MSNRLFAVIAGAAFSLISAGASGNILLESSGGWGINVDGSLTVTGDPLSAGVDGSAFNFTTGLGSLNLTISGSGNHYVSLFVDHEIDEPDNTFFNETGSTVGSVAAGQTWEIDEPGFGSTNNGSKGLQYWGDIYPNFQNSLLDNQSFYDAFDDQTLTGADDVSMALAWDFSLLASEQAKVSFLLSDLLAPSSGFYLHQSDGDSHKNIYFSSALDITDINAVPEPATLSMLLLGALMVVTFKYKQRVRT